MNIGVLGTWMVGQAIATKLVQIGHQVTMGSRTGGNERASFEVATKLNRKDFGINWNKSLDSGSLMLSDEVDIEINL